ncbi:MAG TPA: D-alanyl-D-alanine carboxypeptidase/D-alanyl-D-alanine-endopeptidase [Leptolyngbyaceae cyanobacterium]
MNYLKSLINFTKITGFGKPIGLLLLILSCQLWGRQLSATAQSSTVPMQGAKQVDSSQSICPAQLSAAIDAIANRPQFNRARWGILIQSLASNQTLYNRDAQQYFIPASNTKLLTTAAALRQLGSQYRIRTSVYGSNGVVRVVGRGDPSLTDAQLKDLAQQLKQQGITQVKQLILHDDYFQSPILHPTWEWEDVNADYGAPINSLILNQNVLSLTLLPQRLGQPLQFRWNDPFASLQWQVENKAVTAQPKSENTLEIAGFLGKPVLQIRGQLSADSEPEKIDLPVRDPAENFLQHFRQSLQLEGITVTQAMVASRNQSTNEPELAAVESPPLSQLITDTNQPSNNVYAESLLQTIGATKFVCSNEVSSNCNVSTTEKGLTVLKATLTDMGVDPQTYVIKDGSGLSRHNLISPIALVQLLKGMSRLPEAEIYRVSLPVAGVSGTLKNRFKNTSAQRIVQAKTGTMTGVSSLSGYVDAPNYERLVFSIMVNQSDQPVRIVREGIDEIVVLLTRLRRC